MKASNLGLLIKVGKKFSFAALVIVFLSLLRVNAQASTGLQQGGISSTEMQGYQVQSQNVILDPSDPSLLQGVQFQVYGMPIVNQVQVAFGPEGPWVECDVEKTSGHATAECMLRSGDQVRIQDWEEISVVALSG